MTLTQALLSFAVVAALLTITPGLDSALIIRTAATRSRRSAIATGFGITTGVLIWAVAAALGVSALIAASQTAFLVLRVAGAVYMVFLGVRMIRAALRRRAEVARGGVPGEPGVTMPEPGRDRGVGEAFRQGFFTNLANPKIGAFYVAVLPSFLPPGESPALMGVLLAIVHNVETWIWFALLIVAVDRLRRWLQRPRVQRGLDGLTGLVLVGFGIRLGLSKG